MTVTNASINKVALTSSAVLAAQQQPTLNMKVAGAKGYSMARIDAVSKDFEAQFISQMMESMFSTIDKKGDDINGSSAEDTFQSMMVNEYGKVISRAGGIGVAAQIKQSMLRLQEIGGNNATVSAPAA